MGVAVPIVGAVVGVAGAVQQNNAAKQQANSQRAALDQQAMVEEHNTKMRLIELQRQKLYSDFNFQVQTASRELSKFSDRNALELAEAQDTINRNQQAYAMQSNLLQQQQQTLGLDQSAIQSEFGSQMESTGILSAEAEQARQALTQQANEQAALNAQTLNRDRDMATAMAQFAGMGGAGFSVSDIANLNNMEMLSQQEMADSLSRYNSVVDQVRQGRFNADQVAQLIRDYGQTESNFLNQSAQNSRRFIDTVRQAEMGDMELNRLQNASAFSAARSAMESDYTIREASDRLNQSYYDIQNKSQTSTVQTAAAQQQAALAIQRNSIQNPSSFGVLSALAQGGMSIANIFAPTPRQPAQQRMSGLQPQPYSSFSGGSGNDYGFISGYKYGGYY